MTFPLPHWQAAIVALVLGLLAYLAISNQGLRRERDELQSANGQLSGQLDWQNKTQQAVAAIDESRTRELNDAKHRIDDLQRDVESGRQRLHIAAKCPASSNATAAGVVDAASPGLTDAAQRDYFTLRQRIETAGSQIAGLQDYIRNACIKTD